jgi:hypothetical protein
VTKKPFRPEHVVAVLRWISDNDPAYKGVFGVLAQTGCRAGEAVTLQGRNVEFVDTGDEQGAVIEIEATKCKTGERRVTGVTKDVADLLPRVGKNDYLFRAGRTKWRGKPTHPHLTVRTLLGVLYRALDALGLPRGEYDLHSFRRARITHEHDAGAPRYVSMKNAGHKSAANHDRYTANADWDPIEAAYRVANYRLGVVHQDATSNAENGENGDRNPPPSKGPGGKRERARLTSLAPELVALLADTASSYPLDSQESSVGSHVGPPVLRLWRVGGRVAVDADALFAICTNKGRRLRVKRALQESFPERWVARV